MLDFLDGKLSATDDEWNITLEDIQGEMKELLVKENVVDVQKAVDKLEWPTGLNDES